MFYGSYRCDHVLEVPQTKQSMFLTFISVYSVDFSECGTLSIRFPSSAEGV